jgi:peptidyl-prolyl cis-trans isomerase C
MLPRSNSNLRATILTCLACVASIATASSAAAIELTPDTVLIEKGDIKVTKRDFDLEIARLAPEAQPGIVNNQRRISEVVGRLLVMKTLAHEAREQGLDRDPDVAAKLALETDRFYAQVRQASIDERTAAEFDAKRAQWDARAREMYAVERGRYVTPEQVAVSHILFSTQQHKSDEARRLADEARARVLAGADFHDLARALSEDPTARQNGGRIGFVARADVDPAFAQGAFALKNAGETSEPVLTSFGWHVIKLEDRKPARQQSFDEVREQIVAELRQKYVNERRGALLTSIRSDPGVKTNVQALESMYVRPAAEGAIRQALPAAPDAAPPR